MDALREVENPRQLAAEPRRRWFSSEQLDLIVWWNDAGLPVGFQLCYGKPIAEHALTWTADAGFTHARVDDGESVGFHHKATPILVPDGDLDLARLEQTFREASQRVPKDVVALVVRALLRHPQHHDAA